MRAARIWWTIVIALSPAVMLAGISAQRAMSFPEEDLPEVLAWVAADSQKLRDFIDGAVFPNDDEKILGNIKNPSIVYYPKSNKKAALKELAKRSGKFTVMVGSLTVDRPTASEVRFSFKKEDELIITKSWSQLSDKEFKIIAGTIKSLDIIIPEELQLSTPEPESLYGSCGLRSASSSIILIVRQNPFAWWPGQALWLVNLSK